MLYPSAEALTEDAAARLSTLADHTELGSGFRIAMRDLDIRGAGNLLGEEQSGHVKEVGYELYQTMLEEAVVKLRTGEETLEGEGTWSPQINIGTSVLIPENYVPDLQLRLGLYRRLADLEQESDLDGFGAELHGRLGRVPEEVKHLLDVVSIKLLCRRANVASVDAGPKGALIGFRGDHFANPKELGVINRYLQSAASQEGRTVDEVFSDGFSDWFKHDRDSREGETLIQSIYRRIYDFFSGIYNTFRPNLEGIYRSVARGKPFERPPLDSDPGSVYNKDMTKFTTDPNTPQYNVQGPGEEVDKLLNGDPKILQKLKIPEVMFHITSEENAQKILKEGLLPGKPGINTPKELDNNRVYLAPYPPRGSTAYVEGNSVILKIRTENLNDLKLDPEFFDGETKDHVKNYINEINQGKNPEWALYSINGVDPKDIQVYQPRAFDNTKRVEASKTLTDANWTWRGSDSFIRKEDIANHSWFDKSKDVSWKDLPENLRDAGKTLVETEEKRTQQEKEDMSWTP
jgi:hypothetical protein